MTIPTTHDLLAVLDRLESTTADDLETQWLEFKPWQSTKDDMRIAVEYAACLANAEGGVVVFGVADRTRGARRRFMARRGTISTLGAEESSTARARTSPWRSRS